MPLLPELSLVELSDTHYAERHGVHALVPQRVHSVLPPEFSLDPQWVMQSTRFGLTNNAGSCDLA